MHIYTEKTGYFQSMTTGCDVAAGTKFHYLPCYHGDDVYYPHHFSAPLLHAPTPPAQHIIPAHCMLTHTHTDFKQLDSHMCFLAFLWISHFLVFEGCDYHFPPEELTVIPPVLEIMYLCVWSDDDCPSLLLCHLLVSHMCV